MSCALDSVMNASSLNLRVHQFTLARIEEQLLEKFSVMYPDHKYKVSNEDIRLSNEELTHMLCDWLQFWYSERPLIKDEICAHPVLHMKKQVCDLRVCMIKELAKKFNVLDAMPEFVKLS